MKNACVHCGRRKGNPVAHLAAAIGAAAGGALALGALSIGAVAVGAVAVRRLALLSGRVGKLSIAELEIDRLTIREQTAPLGEAASQ